MLEHHARRVLDVRVGRGRDRVRRHPFPDARFARVHAGGHRLEEVALGEDADQPAEVLDDDGADVEGRHPLGHLAEGVLRGDLDEVGAHDVCELRHERNSTVARGRDLEISLCNVTNKRGVVPCGDAAATPDSTCSWSAAAPPGLAAAVAAERAGARVALATKSSVQANNSSKAQGGIQASFGEDDSPDLHAEDVMRSSHDTANPRARRRPHGRRAVGDPLVRGARLRFTRENGGYRLARCGGASRKRLLQVGDRTGHAITKALREAHEGSTASTFTDHALTALEPARRGGGRRSTSRTAAPRRSTRGRSSSRPAGAATPRRRSGTSFPRTTPTRPVR